MDPFKGKTVLITGASSGIGRQCALDFARQGSHLFLTARRADRLQELTQQLSVPAQYHACDLAIKADRETLIKAVRDTIGCPDILVNNAGYGNFRPFIEDSIDDISHLMDVNYTAAAHLMTAFLPDMLQRGSGSIVNISSGAGKVTLPHMAPYCASKFALCALTEAVAYEVDGSGVTIHLVNPGPVETEFFAAGIWKATPPQKKATAEDVSQAILGALRRNRLISYVPPKRGLMVYVFNLLGPLGRMVMRRKAHTAAGR